MPDIQIQNVPHGQKLQILRDLKATGCRFNGDHLDFDQVALRTMRSSIGRKVPWLLIEQTVHHIRTSEHIPTGGLQTALDHILDGTTVIGKTFVVTMIETSNAGRLMFTIRWAEGLRPFFEKDGKETKTHTIVTKDHIVQFCGSVFSTPLIVFPKATNYPKEWFILMLVLQASCVTEMDDEAIMRAHEVLKPMNRKKKKGQREISNETVAHTGTKQK